MRQIDMEILWPTCKQMAPDLHHAKAAFAVHAFKDWAWLILGEAEIIKAIDKLS
jgi:antirestriction protein